MKKTIISIVLLLTASISMAQSTDYPIRGTSMDGVLKQSGEPDKRFDPVGEPPITRWAYPKFTIYFEHQAVIHSVKNDHKPE